MPDAHVVVAYRLVGALDKHLVVVGQHSSDMREPVAVREAYNSGASEHFGACQDDLAGGASVAGQVLRETRQCSGLPRRSHCRQQVQEHSSRPG